MPTIDFETRSTVDLKICGTSVYARHPSTDVTCLAWERLGVYHIWYPALGKPPQDLFKLIEESETVTAWNSFFERNIWEHVCVKRYGWPAIPDEKWRCTMAAAARLGLPAGLDKCLKALGLSESKDQPGQLAMRRLCKPNKKGKFIEFDDDPVSHKLMHAYCKNDVAVECLIAEHIPEMPKSEVELWQLDQRINARGIQFDREAIHNALAVFEQIKTDADFTVDLITNGYVQKMSQGTKMLKWINEQPLKRPIKSLAKDPLATALKRTDLPENVKILLELRAQVGNTSPTKLQSMLDRMDSDDRVRGTLVYRGAATGRFAAKGLQVHNFPRTELKTPDLRRYHRLLSMRNPEVLDLIFGSPMVPLVSGLRSMLRARKGSVLRVADFSAIESRVLAWLVDQDEVLELYRTTGRVYEAQAAKIYDVDESTIGKDSQERQLGKIAVLGLGYGMGARTFKESCRLRGITIPMKLARVAVQAFRQTNYKVPVFWRDCNDAALEVVRTGGDIQVGKVWFGSIKDWMTITLPSGRELHYRHPAIVEVEAPWTQGFRGWIGGPESLQDTLEDLDIRLGEREGDRWVNCFVPKQSVEGLKRLKLKGDMKREKPQLIEQVEYSGMNPQTKGSKFWIRRRTYGGKLAENIDQAVACDFMAEAMPRLDSRGYPIIATVHDEIVSEQERGQGSLGEMLAIMKEVPDWGAGCPIDAEGFEDERYFK